MSQERFSQGTFPSTPASKPIPIYQSVSFTPGKQQARIDEISAKLDADARSTDSGLNQREILLLSSEMRLLESILQRTADTKAQTSNIELSPKIIPLTSTSNHSASSNDPMLSIDGLSGSFHDRASNSERILIGSGRRQVAQQANFSETTGNNCNNASSNFTDRITRDTGGQKK